MHLIINGLQKITMKLFGTEIVETFQCEQEQNDHEDISMTKYEGLFPMSHEKSHVACCFIEHRNC